MDSVVEFYKFCQPNVDTLWLCLPEIILSALALLALVFDVACKKCAAKRIGAGFIRASLIALFIALVGGAFPVTAWNNFLFFDNGLASGVSALFVVCAFFALNLMCIVRSRESNHEISSPATTHLILIATAAASLLLKATNFVAFFVLLETLTVCLYALVGSNRNSAYSLEAGVKYLIAGGVSGGLMLFGIVLLYGNVAMSGLAAAPVADLLSYNVIGAALASSTNVIGVVGAALVIAGVMFKLGVFPMQFWIPDVYQGAPTHVTFFLASLSKAVGFFLMIPMLGTFFSIEAQLFPILLVCTLISIVYANVTALGQRNVKRLLGLSGVSHAGYLMLGLLGTWKLAALGDVENSAFCIIFVVLYLLVYILTVYLLFSVMARMPQEDDALQCFDDYKKLAKKNSVLGAALAFGLGSLAGIPPTVGFIAKLGILYVLFCAELYGAIAVMLGCVVVSIYYYFGWFRAAFSQGDCCGEKHGECSCNGKCGKQYLSMGVCSRAWLIALSAMMILCSLLYWYVLSGR